MKKLIAVMLAFMLLCMYAGAELIMPDDFTFQNAKNALSCAAGRRYSEVSAILGRDVSGQLETLLETGAPEVYQHGVQTEVAVAWLEGHTWYLAIPLAAPEYNAQNTLVYTLDQNGGFSGVQLLRWHEVESRYKPSVQVVWNTEYNPGYIIVID